MHWKGYWEVLKEAAVQWYADNPFRLGAALAYYTVFSIAPILLISITIASFVFGDEASEGRVVEEISHVVGSQVGEAIQETLKYNAETGSGTLATLISIGVLIVGATTLFAQLQESLNTIWGVQPKPGQGVWAFIRTRILSFAMVLVIGLLLLVSLVLSAALSAATGFISEYEFPGAIYLGQVVNFVVATAVTTLLFAMIYKYLPDVEITWSDVWVGAFVTAILFAVGKFAIGLYLGYASWISSYGAAGSLIVILLWVYYSSQILLFGAEFTQVHANHQGKPMRPSSNAEPVTAEDRERQGLPRESPMTRSSEAHQGTP